MANKDLFTVGGLVAKRSLREHITPHKISVVILIQEYCLLRTKGKYFHNFIIFSLTK